MAYSVPPQISALRKCMGWAPGLRVYNSPAYAPAIPLDGGTAVGERVEGYFVLSPRNLHYLPYKESSAETTSETQRPSNHREFVTVGRQKVVNFARVQGTLW